MSVGDRWAFAAVVVVGASLAGCAAEPAYPVRPGEPRASLELAKPAYPIRPPADTAPSPAYRAAPTSANSTPAISTPAISTPAVRASPPASSADPDAPPPIRPEPIGPGPIGPSSTPSVASAGLGLRGRHETVRPTASTPAATTTVGPDESVFEVAERLRVPVQALLDANGLASPYDVSPGDRLKVPPPTVYVVQPGDTLSNIGRRYAIQPRSIALLNDLSPEARLRPGQRLTLPSGVKLQAAATTPPPPTPLRAEAAPPPPPPPRTATAASAATEPSTDATAAIALGRGKFIWPVKGEILSSFGPKGPGQRNDGVNIAAEAGEPVKAAAAGAVVYAGSSIPGFGNLVVVKHPDGWTSLYGNLGRITVKIRAQVAQGDPIGVAGQSGAVDRPQVHFEVRYAAAPEQKAKPVDPQTVLP